MSAVSVEQFLSTLSNPATRRRYQQALAGFARWFQDVHGSPPDWEQIGDQQLCAYLADRRASVAPATLATERAALRRFLAAPHGLSRPQARRIVSAAARNPRDAALLALLAYAGVRPAQLVRLHLGDVILDDHLVGLRLPAWGRHPGSTIAVPKEALPALSAWLYARPPSGPDRPLFPARGGDALQTGQITRLVRRYARQAGLPWATSRLLAAAG